jgi:hypothetical protein
MKAVPDITEREKAGFAVAAGWYDHGCGPIEFSGEREREASFPDVLRVLRLVEVDRTNTLLNSGPFLLPALTGRISPIRHFPAWLLLPLLWKFVAFHSGIPLSSAFENPQGFGAIGTATPFPKILLGTQSRNLFRHCHIDELI